MEERLKGIAASPGIMIGKAFLLDNESIAIAKRKVSKEDLPLEIARFEEALIKTRSEIIEIKKKVINELGSEEGKIFDAHLLVLEDRSLIEEVVSALRKERYAVEYIFSKVLNRYTNAFTKIDDEYLRERLADVQDVGQRILNNLLGGRQKALEGLKQETIVVTYDLSPSDTISMQKEKIKAFVTDIGGRTSHTAIIARSLEIPAVVGLDEATQRIKNGDTIIVDGDNGLVVINPVKKTLAKYQRGKKDISILKKELIKIKSLPAETKDGHRIQLSANIEFPEEIPSVISHGAKGIGLFRTEYFYMNRVDLPSEDEQFEAYKQVTERLKPNLVIVRTMDLGGDKFISQLQLPRQMNPFLGWRAIRFSLARPDIFKTQLRAILRASAFGNLKVMYPMISGIEELQQANAVLGQCKKELARKKIDFNRNIDVGAMIEIPSAALTAEILAEEVNFFSIGTNDLIQYCLAVDRANEKIAYLYNPAHPAVLKLIKRVIDAGRKHNVRVAMCGEMAADPTMTLMLLGLGLDEFSTSPVSIPQIKKIIRSVTLEDAKKIAEEALKLPSGEKISKFAESELKKIAPNLIKGNN